MEFDLDWLSVILLAMELKELLKWVNGHLRLRDSPEVRNFTKDWVNGKPYLSIIYNVSKL